jgi:hypothetical protein
VKKLSKACFVVSGFTMIFDKILKGEIVDCVTEDKERGPYY